MRFTTAGAVIKAQPIRTATKVSIASPAGIPAVFILIPEDRPDSIEIGIEAVLQRSRDTGYPPTYLPAF
jgi:hypothetical protein